MKAIDNFKNWYKELPEKKKYLEFFTALLTLPMLVTVVMVNLNNLNNAKKAQLLTPSPSPSPVAQLETTISPVVSGSGSATTPKVSAVPTTPVTPTTIVTQTACKKQVGPVSITSPDDNEVITKDPVTIDVTYDKENYCAEVWSYRINGGAWSDYTDKSISLYNLTSGTKQLDVRVKSIASGDEVLLRKTFVYQVDSVTPTITPAVSTASAKLN